MGLRLVVLFIMILWSGGFANVHVGDPPFKPQARFDYLIIAPDEKGILHQAQRLMQLKWQKGLKTYLARTDSISTNCRGADMQEKIRTCIQDEYLHDGITWVLLFGDLKLVPIRKVCTADRAYIIDTNQIYSDIYYACLGDGWNISQDGVFGTDSCSINYHLQCRYDSGGHYRCDRVMEEVSGLDLWSDVYLGRLPVSDSQEAKIVVDKIVSFTTDYRFTQNAQRIFLFGSLLYTTINRSSDVAYYLHGAIKPLLLNAASLYKNAAIDEVYEDSITPGGKALYDSTEITIARLNAGFSKGPALTVFEAHGNSNGIRRCSFASKPDFWIPDVDALPATPFTNVIALSCDVMKMPPESTLCFAKSFLVKPDGGAISFYGCSGYDYSICSQSLIQTALGLLADGAVSRIAQASQIAWTDNIGQENW
ncbi:MAG: C25 family cysteine peptidase, partial [Chitinivibrionales bacterium]|nr:C25 family cysteine peptidase [Chitinivibrionales bacterium]